MQSFITNCKWFPSGGPRTSWLRPETSVCGACKDLAAFREIPERFLNQFVTVDKTCVHYSVFETKQLSKQWKHPGSPRPVMNLSDKSPFTKTCVRSFLCIAGLNTHKISDALSGFNMMK